MRRSMVIFVLLGALLFAGFAWKHYSASGQQPESFQPIIDKLPAVFAQRAFDPASPPSDMPPLGEGEEAECDSNFISDANVSGRMEKTDSTHATVTITQLKMMLQLKITIWVPDGATQHVIEHEEGHRQISEYYYQSADKVAARIAAPHIGQQIAISGQDLNAEFRNALLQLSAQITAEYNNKLNPGPAQQHYDDLTDHSLNDRDAKEVASLALKESL